ncbi:MAG: hypothetical protein LBU89_07265 [Fibromonadaceae bacterium]|jgi:hypothetical protein|nr:hypothetical protein [Fibromonadaceae bacterium]
MRTLQVTVPDVEYARLGIQYDILDFSELERLMERNRLRKKQDKCVSFAEKCGISTMTMDEINAEIKEYRAEKRAKQNAKNNF